MVFVYNAGGQLIAEYHSDPVPPAAGGGGTSYLTSDHLGSTRVVTKSDGSVKARYDYLPFGEELGAGVGARTTGLGYSLAGWLTRIAILWYSQPRRTIQRSRSFPATDCS